MIEPLCRWRFPTAVVPEAGCVELARGHGVSARLLGVLAARGVTTRDSLAAFLGLTGPGLNDPGLLPDAAVVVERIALARSRGERVLVFGDFDADGLTGLAILTLTLRRLGLDAEPYVPSRLEEGHGLSLAAVAAAEAAGRTLILTVDCGTSSGPEIAVANSRGMDVIVTDHHHVPTELPPSLALVNPHVAGCAYPESRLTGAGVAYRVAELVLSAAGDRDGDFLGGLAALATIGTVADVAPILGENRAIARIGLPTLNASPRPGVAALLARAGVAAGSVDLETVGFVIAPRLNAAGRVGEAGTAARLLLTDDVAEAESLAASLEAANDTRRDLTRVVLAEAEASVAVADSSLPAILVRGDWPVGIIGLVAGKLAERRGVPAVVAANLGTTLRGSCRSAPDGGNGLNLAAALASCGDLFHRHGGHAGAAGFELPVDRWDAFRERFLALAAAASGSGEPDRRPELRLDLALPAAEADYSLLRELALLAPTGPGNPDPLVGILGLTATRVRAANGGHTQLTLKRRLDVIDGIAFGRADLAGIVHEGDRVDVVGRLVSRRFGGLETLQLEIRDVATSGSHPEAAAILAGAAASPGSRGAAPAAFGPALALGDARA